MKQKFMKIFRVLMHNKRAFFGFIVFSLFILMALIGPWIVKLDTDIDYMNRFQSVSFKHWLGTDYAGRDTFSQIVHGSRDVMIIAFSTAFFATMLAVSVGIFSGFMGGKTDLIIMKTIDIFLTLPQFPIMAIFAGLFRVKDAFTFGILLAFFCWAGLARAIRTQTLSIKNKEFVEVCRIMNMPTHHIVFKELMPNMVPFISVNFIHIAKGAITASVGIMLLGIVPLVGHKLGNDAQSSRQTNRSHLRAGSPSLFAISYLFHRDVSICIDQFCHRSRRNLRSTFTIRKSHGIYH